MNRPFGVPALAGPGRLKAGLRRHLIQREERRVRVRLSNANIVDFEVADFTIDCNVDGQPMPEDTAASAAKAFPQVICGAIRVGGSRSRVRRIRAINWGGLLHGGVNPECFVLTVGWPIPGGNEVVDCVVEECILEQPSENSADLVTCIGIGGGASGAVQIYH